MGQVSIGPHMHKCRGCFCCTSSSRHLNNCFSASLVQWFNSLTPSIRYADPCPWSLNFHHLLSSSLLKDRAFPDKSFLHFVFDNKLENMMLILSYLLNNLCVQNWAYLLVGYCSSSPVFWFLRNCFTSGYGTVWCIPPSDEYDCFFILLITRNW